MQRCFDLSTTPKLIKRIKAPRKKCGTFNVITGLPYKILLMICSVAGPFNSIKFFDTATSSKKRKKIPQFTIRKIKK